jgi:uncharacterized membrane protein
MSTKMISNAISAVLALGLAGSSYAASNEKNSMSMTMGNIEGMEKCYGIAKAGRNDCGTASHHCAGESKLDREKEAWMLVPSGTCQKIAGSEMKAPEKA